MVDFEGNGNEEHLRIDSNLNASLDNASMEAWKQETMKKYRKGFPVLKNTTDELIEGIAEFEMSDEIDSYSQKDVFQKGIQ